MIVVLRIRRVHHILYFLDFLTLRKLMYFLTFQHVVFVRSEYPTTEKVYIFLKVHVIEQGIQKCIQISY